MKPVVAKNRAAYVYDSEEVIQMKDDIISRFSSRKFLAAVVGGIVTFLASAGVIDPSTTDAVTGAAIVIAYVVVQGVIDFFA